MEKFKHGECGRSHEPLFEVDTEDIGIFVRPLARPQIKTGPVVIFARQKDKQHLRITFVLPDVMSLPTAEGTYACIMYRDFYLL